jgi:anti-repressor protein
VNAIQPFQFDGTDVRVVTQDGEPWFVLADVCRVLDIANPSDAASRIDQDALGTAEVIDSMGRTQRARIVEEAGVYEVVFLSRKPEARHFKRWITREVIPQIRRTGSYAVAPVLPQDYATALRALASEVEAKQLLAAKVEADAPKVLFADAVATSHTEILVGELAKILRGNGVQVGGTRMFEWLRRDGYLIRREGTDWNMPTQRSMELGLFRIKETAITHSDGHTSVSKTPKVTGKGQAYFVNRYAPTAEVAA